MLLLFLIVPVVLAEFSDGDENSADRMVSRSEMSAELDKLAEMVNKLNTRIDTLEQEIAARPVKRTYEAVEATSSSTAPPTTTIPGPSLESRVERLESLSKVGTLRSCAEYASYGIRTSGVYNIDPDGLLIGEPPIEAICTFDGENVFTEILHDSEMKTKIEHCHDPGCFTKNITYINGSGGEAIALSQIEALMDISEACDQSFLYDCTLAPLRDNSADMAFWYGRDGSENVYWTGNVSEHQCDCNLAPEGCIEQEVLFNTCNCDAKLPEPLQDTGRITNMDALPIQSVAFGGLTYDLQSAAFLVGRLRCRGEKSYEKSTSCQALKLAGHTYSGYYTIKKTEELHSQTVYCDFSSSGYEEVVEVPQLTGDAPLGTISAWSPKNNLTSDLHSLPEGWLPCDGTVITRGPWAGGRTPDINNEGFFLRGSSEEAVLETENHQLEDHEHSDPGHTHSNRPHTHDYTIDINLPSSNGALQSGTGYYAYSKHETRTSQNSTISIDSSLSDLGGVESAYNSGSETRPKNMHVVYIMKCW